MGWTNKNFWGLCFTFLGMSLSAQELPKTLSEIPPHASYSILVRDLNDKKELISVTPQRTLVSASLMKLVTTATALEVLGHDYQFSTRFWINGPVLNGELNGNLIVEGGGDPTLGSQYFKSQSPEIILSKVLEFLKEQGIERIEGNILVDNSWIKNSRFPSRRLWEDMGNYYGAPPAALTWKDNSFNIGLKSSSQLGQKCDIVEIDPPLKRISITSNVVSASHQNDSAYIYGLPGMRKWEIRGSIPAGINGFIIKGALPYPGMTFASEVAGKVLLQPGIGMQEVTDSGWKSDARLIGEIKSPHLSEIVREINHRSLNLGADHLLLALGKKAGNINLSDWDGGLELIRKYWGKRLTQPYYNNIKDGSGLAPLNTLSSVFLVGMIDYMYNNSPNRDVFKTSLAQSGRSGTLKYVWNDGVLNGKVWGKSGSMQDVMCYSGYVFRQGKSPLAFAIMVNHFGIESREVRKIIEKILEESISG
ncbi:D-alanyl-D-alanine carboxypeptidase/D-alanyl-D-alanine endopeptidase [Marinilabilia rubra]|uniref:D-alanyl-D-alanine carboxypeptidase/D-alanyl-D-alanine-endopeptidase n=1 Tax=Marinilabilia rubra TaxID=2162893 RepID=A0A2U2BC86_9BACT|nr:D-alanyl-D-alanine carboxypeptidase/D-alanyl-D-alanine-endopeptidase [Marinilabilia rubra]PWE00679.1 D-alanyl-D-alanine carboxypeptidase/D-alanyl-D-alanine-endopeptidase [Marinilabilia rubra]